MTRSIRIAVPAAVVVLGLAHQAFACECSPGPIPVFESSNVVFVGRTVAADHRMVRQSVDGRLVTLSNTRVRV
jgi:hypothetical protein